MPTCSWIREKDSEAFYAAIESVPDPIDELARTWKCPFCVLSFREPDAWRIHLSNIHSGQRPFLIFGAFEPSSTDIIRKRIDAEKVGIFNTTSVSISWDNVRFNAVSQPKLCSELSTSSDGRLWVRLENRFDTKAEPIHTTYDLSFRVYDDEAKLKGVDQTFVKLLGKDAVTMDDVDGFFRQTEKFSVPDYRDAMADYVVGVLVKDGDNNTGVRSATRDYGSRYDGALTVLQEFARPLPRLLCTLIRFSRNDFSLCRLAATGFDLLDSANAQLSPLARNGGVWSAVTPALTAEARLTICPVDNGSWAVLWRGGQLASTARWSRDLEAQLQAETDLPTLDPEDRLKLYALWAAAAVRLHKKRVRCIRSAIWRGAFPSGNGLTGFSRSLKANGRASGTTLDRRSAGNESKQRAEKADSGYADRISERRLPCTGLRSCAL